MRREMDTCNVGEQLAVDLDGLALLLDIREEHAATLLRDARLPEPVRLGCQARWRVAEIRDWLAAGAPPADIWREIRSCAPPASPPPTCGCAQTVGDTAATVVAGGVANSE